MRGPEGASVQQCTGATRHLMRLLAQVHDQVPGLLSGPLPGWMKSDPEDADAPAGVLDHGQDMGLGAVQQVGGEEVARQDRLGWERRNCGQPRPVRRGAGSIPAFFRISHAVDAATFTPRPASTYTFSLYRRTGASTGSFRLANVPGPPRGRGRCGILQ